MDNPETSTILDTQDTVQDKQNENATQKTKNMTNRYHQKNFGDPKCS